MVLQFARSAGRAQAVCTITLLLFSYSITTLKLTVPDCPGSSEPEKVQRMGPLPATVGFAMRLPVNAVGSVPAVAVRKVVKAGVESKMITLLIVAALLFKVKLTKSPAGL